VGEDGKIKELEYKTHKSSRVFGMEKPLCAEEANETGFADMIRREKIVL